MTDPSEPPDSRPSPRPGWTLAAVALAYAAVTMGESILAPIFPVVATELPFDLSLAGTMFGALTASTAAGNIGGGFLLARIGPRWAAVLGLALTVLGSAGAWFSATTLAFGLANVVLGLGAGFFFAPGIHAVGRIIGRRRGMAMGLYGIAFSVGLALASALVAVFGEDRWRSVFAAAGAVSTAALVVLLIAPVPTARPRHHGRRPGSSVGPATLVASVAAIGQFGVVALLPTFAVTTWGWSKVAAASLLAVGRVASIPGKAVAGSLADRIGGRATARWLAAALLASGLGWILLPPGEAAAGLAIAFVAVVGSLFPVANLLAYEGFGDRGPLLGAYRSIQLGVAAVAVWLMGSGWTNLGSRWVLTAGVLTGLAVFTPASRRTPAPPG